MPYDASGPIFSCSDVSLDLGGREVLRDIGFEMRPGEVLGIIRDYAGREVEQVVSPVDGYALYGITGPPVEAGDAVVTIAIPTTGF